EMKSWERDSASSTILPSSSAAGVASSNCRLRLTEPDCGPAVPRPSTHSAASKTWRQRSTCFVESTCGIESSTAKPPATETPARPSRTEVHCLDRGTTPIVKRLILPVQRQVTSPPRRHEGKRCRIAIDRIVVELIGDIDDVQLRGKIFAELVFG